MNGTVCVYGWEVRTNIEIDDELLAEAQALAGTRTKKATVEFALAELVRRRRAKSLLQLRGTVDFDIDLDESRRGRP
jgi:Arc/MetJ family transcription regulator